MKPEKSWKMMGSLKILRNHEKSGQSAKSGNFMIFHVCTCFGNFMIFPKLGQNVGEKCCKKYWTKMTGKCWKNDENLKNHHKWWKSEKNE